MTRWEGAKTAEMRRVARCCKKFRLVVVLVYPKRIELLGTYTRGRASGNSKEKSGPCQIVVVVVSLCRDWHPFCVAVFAIVWNKRKQ